MASVSIHLFGRFELRRAQTVLEKVPGGKMKELLCYLLLHHNQTQPREALATVLWPDCSAMKSRKYLRQALWQLQAALKRALIGQQAPTLSIDSRSIHLNAEECFSVDVTVFERAYELTRGVPAAELDNEKAMALGQAVRLYRGDLLEGCYEDWCLGERERLQNCYLSMLGKLILYCQSHHDYQQGLQYGESVLRLDRAHEATHRQLMDLHYQEGNRTEALRQYERCRKALREELEVQPSRQTQELYARIQADKGATPAMSLLAFPAPATSGTVERLENLLKCIAEAETEIRKEIRDIYQTSENQAS
jgi:DNA-binding SARP family transcriptional activator